MLEAYSQEALDELLAQLTPRRGWDFSCMNVLRQPVPWNYHDPVVRYLRPNDTVLDIGTGGGETFTESARFLGRGLGIDTDAEMIQLAVANPIPATFASVCAANGLRRCQRRST